MRQECSIEKIVMLESVDHLSNGGGGWGRSGRCSEGWSEGYVF